MEAASLTVPEAVVGGLVVLGIGYVIYKTSEGIWNKTKDAIGIN